ncbi:MAG: M48 family metallopeptidase [bacterium]|nr:M48 family metallopeptidase [bacterium]MDZ4299575.1 M48 family metallopeptidase [Candidatus Sungbacteria bacterium]
MIDETGIIVVNEKQIPFCVRRSRRARRIAVSISREGEVVLTVPWRGDERAGRRFLQSKATWILKRRLEILAKPLSAPTPSAKEIRAEYLRLRIGARGLVERRIAELNAPYGFSFNCISIRNQKTRWGSCSSRGTLSFNYRIVFLTPELADYLVVHELCHLKEKNHGARFWRLVGASVPDYKEKRRTLRRWHLSSVSDTTSFV